MSIKTRTEHSAKNTSIATISRMIIIIMGFATRVVFTHTLSEAYVGVNGLFTDLLNVLVLSELGIGTAFSYALYRPIAEGDVEKQKSLMKIYRLYYQVIAGIVFLAGLALIPFMDQLIKNKSDVGNIIIIYLLYLINSALSYIFIYKKTLVDAHQKSYISTIYQTYFWVAQDIIQIIILIFTRNFILFLIIYIADTLGSNIVITRKANILYPFLKEKNIQPLEKEKRRELFKNVRAMFMHKIGKVAVNNTDNLLLSYFVGMISVGCYSNYYLIIKSISQVFEQMFKGITASVGNLGVTEEPETVKRVYDSAFFVSIWAYGVAGITLYEVINPFVAVSFGENYQFAKNIVLVLCINFLISGIKDSTLVFRDSLGLFWNDRYLSIIEAGLNLIISIVLVKQFGTVGVFIGTMISMLITSAWIEPFLIYKNYLQRSFIPFFMNYLRYMIFTALIWIVIDYICNLISGGIIFIFFTRLIICLIVPQIIMLVLYFRTNEFKYIFDKGRDLWQRKKKIQ